MFEMIAVVCGIAYGVERCETADFGPFDSEEVCEVAKPLIEGLFVNELRKNGVAQVEFLAACREKDQLI